MIYIRVFSASRNAERNLARNPDFQILNRKTGSNPGNPAFCRALRKTVEKLDKRSLGLQNRERHMGVENF